METTEEWHATRECSLTALFNIYTNDQSVHEGTSRLINIITSREHNTANTNALNLYSILILTKSTSH